MGRKRKQTVWLKLMGQRDPGYVYVATDGLDYKIGWSWKPPRRMKELGLPASAVVHTIHTEYPRFLERQLHDMFASKRMPRPGPAGGEWFELSDSDVRRITNLGEELPYGLEE